MSVFLWAPANGGKWPEAAVTLEMEMPPLPASVFLDALGVGL